MMIFLVLSVFFEGLFRTLERVGMDRIAFILVKKKQAEACFFYPFGDASSVSKPPQWRRFEVLPSLESLCLGRLETARAL